MKLKLLHRYDHAICCSLVAAGLALVIGCNTPPAPEKLTPAQRENYANASFQKAERQFEAGAYEKAKTLIDSGLQYAPSSPNLLILKAKVMFRLRMEQETPPEPRPGPDAVVLGEPIKITFHTHSGALEGIEQLGVEMRTDPGGDEEILVLRLMTNGIFRGQIATQKGEPLRKDGVLQARLSHKLILQLCENDRKLLGVQSDPDIRVFQDKIE